MAATIRAFSPLASKKVKYGNKNREIRRAPEKTNEEYGATGDGLAHNKSTVSQKRKKQ
jgi:hypothetical protein